jgi:hypothetical protein
MARSVELPTANRMMSNAGSLAQSGPAVSLVRSERCQAIGGQSRLVRAEYGYPPPGAVRPRQEVEPPAPILVSAADESVAHPPQTLARPPWQPS